MSRSLLIVDDSTTMWKILVRTIRRSGISFDQLKADGAKGYITKPFTPDQIREKLTPPLN